MCMFNNSKLNNNSHYDTRVDDITNLGKDTLLKGALHSQHLMKRPYMNPNILVAKTDRSRNKKHN